MNCLYCGKPGPKKRYHTQAHYHTWEGVIMGYHVVDRQTGYKYGPYTSRNHATYLARLRNKQENQPGISHQGLCPECKEKYSNDEQITVKLREGVILDFRRYTRELREAEKLVKVPLTSAATAMRIRNAMGLAAVCLESLLWAIDEQKKEAGNNTIAGGIRIEGERCLIRRGHSLRSGAVLEIMPVPGLWLSGQYGYDADHKEHYWKSDDEHFVGLIPGMKVRISCEEPQPADKQQEEGKSS